MKYFSLYRIYVIVSMAVRIFIEIILFKRKYRNRWNEQIEIKWKALLQKQARRYKKKALYLEGVMIKLGQYLSTRKDIIPPEYIVELEGLLDQVPPVSWERSKKVLEDEWKKPHQEVLKEISPEPIASASIGEVYKATLHNGEVVAVKIQRPKISDIIQSDFKAVRIILWLTKRFTKIENQVDLSLFYKEVVKTIGNELNFELELESGLYFKKRYEDFQYVVIPTYYPDLSTKRILVMEWMEGSRVTDLKFIEKNGIDREQLGNQLIECFLGQLLEEGKFHADPHPGNILVNAKGSIILIDFGMIGVIKRQDAMHIRNIAIGVLLKDYGKIVNAIEGMHFLLPHANKAEIEELLKILIEMYSGNGIKADDTKLMEELMTDIEKLVHDQPIQLPSEYAFLGRAISTFIGILYSLDPHMDLLEMCKPIITKWLKANKKGIKDTAIEFVRSFAEPIASFPSQLQQFFEEPKRNREWQRKNELLRMEHEMMISRKRDAFLLCLISFVFAIGSYFFNRQYLFFGGTGLFIISYYKYRKIISRHKKLLKNSR